jgi:2-iminobutanoate/2-iminopropanoate deaminase
MKKVIQCKEAPPAIGPYSQAVLVNGFLYTSGMVPLDPVTGDVVRGDIKIQTARVFENLALILQEAGYTFHDVVKVTVYIKNMDDFGVVNEIYARYINGSILPARACVQVARLPKDVLIEIDLVAYK